MKKFITVVVITGALAMPSAAFADTPGNADVLWEFCPVDANSKSSSDDGNTIVQLSKNVSDYITSVFEFLIGAGKAQRY